LLSPHIHSALPSFGALIYPLVLPSEETDNKDDVDGSSSSSSSGSSSSSSGGVTTETQTEAAALLGPGLSAGKRKEVLDHYSLEKHLGREGREDERAGGKRGENDACFLTRLLTHPILPSPPSHHPNTDPSSFPPTFLYVSSSSSSSSSPSSSLQLASALAAAGVPHTTFIDDWEGGREGRKGGGGGGLGGRSIRSVENQRTKGWLFERRGEGGREGGVGGVLQFLHPWTRACLAFWEKEGVLPPKDEDGVRRRKGKKKKKKKEGGGEEGGEEERVSVSTEADGSVVRVPDEEKGERVGGQGTGRM